MNSLVDSLGMKLFNQLPMNQDSKCGYITSSRAHLLDRFPLTAQVSPLKMSVEGFHLRQSMYILDVA